MFYDDSDRCIDCGHLPERCGCTHNCVTDDDEEDEQPESQRATQERDRDAAWAVSTLIASLGDDTAATVTSWLRVVRLTDAQRETIRQALGDGLAYRERKSYVKCADCDASPTSLCDDHAADFDRIERYTALARELGIEVSGS